MKKLLFALTVLLAFYAAQAAPILIIGSLVTVSNATAYSTTNQTFQNAPNMQMFTISHGALVSTNDLPLAIQSSTDQVNFTNSYVWYPSTTNAATEYIYAGTIPVTNYFRVKVVTTNSVQVGGSYGQ